MAVITVIKSDTAIYVDEVPMAGCDMAGLPDDLHALQWNGTNGHVEYTGNVKPNLTVSSEEEVESALGVSLSTLIERQEARIAETGFDLSPE